MKFIVAGASGAFRRPIMERFVYVGHQATGIVRSPSEAHDLVRLGVELVDFDGAAVERALTRAELVLQNADERAAW